jgi:hypothetical protein
VDCPAIGLVAARREAEKRRLPGAVRPHQSDPLAPRHRRRDVLDDDELTDLAGRGLEAEDRH